MDKKQAELNAGLRSLKEEKQCLEGELQNLVDVITSGYRSPTIVAAINEREARIPATTNQLGEPGPGSLEEKLDEFRNLAFAHLDQMRLLLSKLDNVLEARATSS